MSLMISSKILGLNLKVFPALVRFGLTQRIFCEVETTLWLLNDQSNLARRRFEHK